MHLMAYQKILNESEAIFEHRGSGWSTLIGIWFFASGIVGFGVTIGAVRAIGFRWEAVLAFLMFGIFSSAFLFGGLAMLLWTDELHLNLLERTYRRERGPVPWIKKTTGSMNDLLHVACTEGGEGGWFVELTWKSAKQQPFRIAGVTNYRETGKLQEFQEQLAAKLGLPTDGWRSPPAIEG